MARPDGGGPDLRGRDAEWRVVGELLRRARDGAGGVVLVDGERGIGKSLLLREAGRAASRQGFSVATGVADRLGQQLPFFALRQALRGPAGQGDTDSRPPGQDYLQRQITELRDRLVERASAAPVLVSVDDLQWASQETLLALRVLPRDLARHPVAWILARSVGHHLNNAGCLFELLEEEGASLVSLGPLAEEVVTGMLAETFGAPPGQDLAALAASAAGSPSLLTGLITGLREENAVRLDAGRATLIPARLPEQTVDAAREWLGDLSEPVRQLLGTAALLGKEFRLDDVSELLAVPPARLLGPIRAALDAGIIAANDQAFSFRHGLVARAAVELIPAPARRVLHRHFGEILLRRGEPAVAAATHLIEAAHVGDAVSLAVLDRAVEEAVRSAPRTAADLALRALKLTTPDDPAAIPRAVTAAEMLTAAGRPAAAAEIVHDLLSQPLPAAAEARLRCALSSVLYMSGHARDAMDTAAMVLALPDVPDTVRERGQSAWLQAAAGLTDDTAVTRAAATVLAASAEHAGDLVAAARTAQAIGRWNEGKISESLDLLRAAARDGSGSSPDARHCQPLLVLCARLIDLRQLAEATAIIRAAADRVPGGSLPHAVASLLRSRLYLGRGLLDKAAVEGEAALAAAQSAGASAYASAAHSVLAVIASRRGDRRSAIRHTTSSATLPSHAAMVYAPAETALAAAQAVAQVAAASDDPTVAISQVRDLCADLSGLPALLLGDPGLGPWVVRAALAAGEDWLAEKVAVTVGSLAEDNPDCPAIATATTHVRGLLARNAEYLRQAAAQHEDPWTCASATEDLAVAHAGQGDQDQAIEYLNKALEAYARVGAAADEARVRARLRDLGVRRRHWETLPDRPVIGWESLTDTERAVTELVAEGLTNRQAADRLYISRHTVAHHLREAFRKLNIGSRVELTRIAVQHSQR